MARTGKKSVKAKPEARKEGQIQRRRIKKSSGERDRGLKEALDKELTSEDLVMKSAVVLKKPKPKPAGVDEAGLLASFDQLRGL